MKKINVKCCCCGRDFVQEYDEKKEHVGEESMFVCDDRKCLSKFQKLEHAVD